MLPSDHTEEKPEPTSENGNSDQSETIVHHTVVDHQSGDAIKKLITLFKSSPETETPKTSVPRQVNAATGPRRSSGQGILGRSRASQRTPNPDRRLQHFVKPQVSDSPSNVASVPPTDPPSNPFPRPAKKINLKPSREKARMAFWDVAGILSLVVNAVLIGLLLVMSGQIRNLKSTLNGLLGGLYGNFVEMDNASITSTIPVEAQIPVVFNLPIQQTTSVTLTSDVPIPGTHVVINSGGLSINAPATVTLPAGTSLPISLAMDIPVQLTVPISLQVPVNIPMSQTALHAPFSGLQKTVLPLYCTIDKNAQYPQGFYLCAGHESTTPATP